MNEQRDHTDPHAVHRRLILVASVAAAAVVLDQATKALAQAWLPPRTLHILGGTVRMVLSENAGAFLSLGASLSPTLRFWIFTVASAAMLAAVTVYAVIDRGLPGDVVLALACVTGGGVGNLIDRVTRDGHVIDFLNFGIGNLRTGILNVADIFITFGALYVMWAAIRGEQAGKKASQGAGD